MVSKQVLPLFVLSLLVSSCFFTPIASANSLEVDGPGFKMAKRTGWFGQHSTVYNDMLGNRVERSTGILGRTTTRTRVFGTDAYHRGSTFSVTAPNGFSLINTHRSWLGGKQTRVDGNHILQSFKGLFSSNHISPKVP